MAAIRDDVRDAVDLITQPWVLEVLVGTESGHAPRSAVAADADPDELRAAVDRLMTIGAVNTLTNEATQDEPLTLTPRGAELLRLLRELEKETAT
jgi:hypothetical protein